MKMIKSLVLGSAAGLIAVGGAQAADLPVKAKAVEYVKVCSLYGAGFFYIPGTDTCIKLGGYLRADVVWNTNNDYGFLGGSTGAQNRLSNYWTSRARFSVDWDTRTATEYGVVRTFATILTSYTNSGVLGSNTGATSQDVIVAGSSGVTNQGIYQAFIQFAGFTIGRQYSIFDAPWQSYPAGGPDTLAGASNHVTGVDALTYTASFGNGVTGSISVEDPQDKDTAGITNLSNITSASLVTGAYGSATVGGLRSPDIIGQVRVDQAWGLAQFAVAAHDNHAAYYGGPPFSAAVSGTELAGAPSDKWGWAVQGALSIKNIPTGPGDTINMTAVYTDGATNYNTQWLFPKTGSLYGGSGAAFQGLTFFGISDTTFVNGGGQESVKSWGFNGGYTHNWSPTWASSIYGSYAQVRYGTNAINTICTAVRAIAATPGSVTSCSPNVNFATIGGTTVWTPVKNLAFTVDVNYTFIDQGYAGTIASPGNASFGKPAAVYELKDQGRVSALFRAQRNF